MLPKVKKKYHGFNFRQRLYHDFSVVEYAIMTIA